MMQIYAHTVVARFRMRWQVLDMDNLARIRKARRLTQSQLAEAVGANQATISKIEKGQGNPTLDMIQRIAAALKVHPSQLFTRDALEQRAVDALDQMTDDHAKEAAIIVLETMAHRAR
jgi:transcriptional regulator with XRE-family HTH domain